MVTPENDTPILKFTEKTVETVEGCYDPRGQMFVCF